MSSSSSSSPPLYKSMLPSPKSDTLKHSIHSSPFRRQSNLPQPLLVLFDQSRGTYVGRGGDHPIMNRKPGDWNCRACSHLNFSRRDSCQRCGDPRAGGDFGGGFGGSGGGRGGSSFGFSGSDVRPGDWYCSCGTHNFASRSNCFRCGAFKDDAATGGGAGGFDGADVPRPRGGYGFGSSGGGRSGWKSGDWICTRSGCNEHNFASRMECFRCNAPRETANQSSY